MIDPFYTVDMSIPDDPKVVGELKIPGFSVSCRCAVIFEPHSVYEATTVFNELFFSYITVLVELSSPCQ